MFYIRCVVVFWFACLFCVGCLFGLLWGLCFYLMVLVVFWGRLFGDGVGWFVFGGSNVF